MSTTLRFRDHEEFQRAALHMAVVGGLVGLAVEVVYRLIPSLGGLGAPWSVAALVAAAAYGAAQPAARTRVTELALLGALAVCVGVALKLAANKPNAFELALAVTAAGYAIPVARGGRRPFLTFVASAIAAGLSFWVCSRMIPAAEDAAVPNWIIAGGGGAVFAFLCVLGLLPRHVDVGQSRVQERWSACRSATTGEVRELADRAMSVWQKVDATLEPESTVRRAIEDSVVRLFDVGARWASVESDGARTPADALVERMEAIAAKIAATEDPVAKGQYQQAHAALGEQLRYLREIATARERVIARMHHYLAAMERLRFAVINHRSADASRLSTEVQPILDDLKDLGREIDFSSEAMGEVEGDALVRPPAQA